MPTKTTPKTSAKKADSAKTAAKPATAPKAPAKASTKTTAAEKTKAAPAEVPAAAKVPKEVVSLIEPRQKTVRKPKAASLENKPFSTLPSISKFLEPEPAKTSVA